MTAYKNKGNSTLAELRGAVRQRVNEVNAGFWTDAALNQYIQSAVNDVHALAAKISGDRFVRYKDFTYTSGAEFTAVSFSSDYHTPDKILFLEDRSGTTTPGQLIMPLDSLGEVYWGDVLPTDYRISNAYGGFRYVLGDTGDTSTKAIECRVYLSPPPGSGTAMRLHYQAGAPDLSSDTYLTGMTPEQESLAITKACIMAKMQEGDGVPQEWFVEEQKRENFLKQMSSPMKRGGRMIQYIED